MSRLYDAVFRLAGVFAIMTIGWCSLAMAQVTTPGATLDSLYVLPEGVETRWASAENFKGEKGVAAQANAGRKGSPNFGFPNGEQKILAEVSGTSGCVRRIWVTISTRTATTLRGIRLDMYWDGADKPAVSVPLGDFFCQPLGQMAAFQNALFSSPEGRSFNTCVPMPFKTGMKIVVTNESGQDVRMFFYDVNYTIGDQHPDKVLYFHAHWRRENPTTMKQDFAILPRVEGAGRYLGTCVSVIPNTDEYYKAWWGEGEVKIYLDGDKEFPTLAGTGTEDYIGTGWGQGRYDQLYQGCHVAGGEQFRYGFYRLHIPDPVYFRKDIRVTIQQIGFMGSAQAEKFLEAGKTVYRAGPGMQAIDLEKQPGGLFERRDDWAACAYFYLDQPTNNLPGLADVAQRIADLD